MSEERGVPYKIYLDSVFAFWFPSGKADYDKQFDYNDDFVEIEPDGSSAKMKRCI
jgi:hypothetical protein